MREPSVIEMCGGRVGCLAHSDTWQAPTVVGAGNSMGFGLVLYPFDILSAVQGPLCFSEKE